MSNIVCVGDGGMEIQTELGVVRGVHFRRRDGKRIGFVGSGGTDVEVSLVAQGTGPQAPEAEVVVMARRHDGSGQAGIVCVTEERAVLVQGERLALEGSTFIDLGEMVTEPMAPVASCARLFVRRCADGRLQLCVAFPRVPAVVLASE